MVVGVEKSRGPVARLDWGDEQAKNDVPTDIFSQGHQKALNQGQENPLKIFSRGREKPAANQPSR